MKNKNSLREKIGQVCLMCIVCILLCLNQAYATQCSDGLDNDLDGKVDYPDDPGCASASASEEFDAPAPPAAVNGLVAGGLMWYPVPSIGPNLLTNPGFEEVDVNGNPLNWVRVGYSAGNGFQGDSTTAHSGSRSALLKNADLTSLTDEMRQYLFLRKGSYRMSGWVKMDNIVGDNKGVRISGIGSTNVISGTSDWQYLEIKNVVVTQDTTNNGVILQSYRGASGIAWFDDIELHEELPFPIEVFKLYPNYRGYLFDDQSQAMRFDITVNPPSGTQLSDWRVEASVIDESSNSPVLNQTFSAVSNFVASIDGSSLVNGKTYLVRFKLVRISDSAALYEYPAYRISKVSGITRSSMPMSFDENNRILFHGQPKFLLGVYDSALDTTLSEITWENKFFSPTGERRMTDLPINFYYNYWFGESPVSVIRPMSNVLQRHGIYFMHTGNCFNTAFTAMDRGFPIYTNDTYLSDLSTIPGLAGFATMDECIPILASRVFTATQRLISYKPDGITHGNSNKPSSFFYWRDVADLLSMDPYPLYGPEPVGGYNLSSGTQGVADWTRKTKEAVKNSRPIAMIIQFFQFTSNSRWPTQAELRNMGYMAIAEGANGLVYWSLGANALAWICDGSDAYHSPSGSASWCQARVDNFNNLKAVVTELNNLQSALSGIDRNDLLAGNSNSSIRTRVKFANNKGYLIASNYTNTIQSATFSWNQAPASVSVYNEARTLAPAANSFTDTFNPYEAHVYEIDTAGSSVLYGDVSENGTVSAYDASLAAQYTVGLITLTPEQITKADVSGNSAVSSYDASLIAQYAVGLITKFPVEG